MTKDLSVKNQQQKSSFYCSCQVGNHELNGVKQASTMMKAVYADKENNHFKLGIGVGSVNTLSAELGHEIRWSEFGLDLSLKGERNKQLLKNTEYKDVTLEDGTNMTLSNQYRPSDVRLGLGAEATYRPNKGVKLGLGVEAGVVVPTTQNNKVEIKPYDEVARFRHSHLPEGYVTPKASAEIALDKEGSISIIGDASLYEAKAGIIARFGK